MVSLLSDDNLWRCYDQWRLNANRAYLNWYGLVEIATDPKVVKLSVSVYQELGRKEEEYLQTMWHCEDMSKPYLAELVHRGLVEEGMIQ